MVLKKTKDVNLYTHSGKFHADDVFSTAFIDLIDDRRIVVHRVNEITPEMEEEAFRFDAYIYDIGGGEFDHHQLDSPVRPNGVQYASFGRLVRHFWINKEFYLDFDEKIVQPIDKADTSTDRNIISDLIGRYNAEWDENLTEKEIMNNFMNAVEFAKTIIKAYLINAEKHIKAQKSAEEIAKTAEEVTPIVILLEQYAPIYQYFYDSQYKFFIAKGNRDKESYNIVALRTEDGDNKALIPEEYRLGASASEKFTGMTFCHKSGFLAAFNSKEAALKFAREELWWMA